jgi:TolB protein
LLVQGTDGNIFTIAPDGSRRRNLTSDAGATRRYSQPIWSPDATTIAFARTDFSTAGVGGALITMQHDGTGRVELPLAFPPFYMAWSPAGDQIAYLSNWQGLEGPTMALRLVDVAANTAGTLAEGSPYYFSWSPNGDALLAHIGSNRMELQRVTGERRALAQTPADFGAPHWLADGERLVYAVGDAAGQQVIVADLQGVPLQQVTDFEDRVGFALSPDGARIAYVLTAAGAPSNTYGPLYVAELETLRTVALPAPSVLANFWSPDGSKLAYLARDTSNPRRTWLRWNVWDGSATVQYERFAPTLPFVQSYLAFSDQYAQSLRVWSPDSRAITYAGISEAGERGVFVQRLGEGRAQRITSGEVATWSPQ